MNLTAAPPVLGALFNLQPVWCRWLIGDATPRVLSNMCAKTVLLIKIQVRVGARGGLVPKGARVECAGLASGRVAAGLMGGLGRVSREPLGPVVVSAGVAGVSGVAGVAAGAAGVAGVITGAAGVIAGGAGGVAAGVGAGGVAAGVAAGKQVRRGGRGGL